MLNPYRRIIGAGIAMALLLPLIMARETECEGECLRNYYRCWDTCESEENAIQQELDACEAAYCGSK